KLVADRFAALIRRVSEKQSKRVVILVDEYDKPILDNLENTFLAGTLRDGLKDFYSVLKESDAYIRFCFITGVSKFSRVSIFSDLNNLEDISLDPKFGDICGYTEKELTTVFADRLDGIDVNELRHWYNGYSFLGKNRVYNPFDVLLFFKKQALGNYWFESATPSFLINLLRDNRIFVPNLDGTEVGEAALSSFTIDHLLPETVLFQSGYLTIKEKFTVGPRRFFRLGFPNQEVRLSFTDALLAEYTQSRAPQAGLQNTMYRALEQRDMDRVHSTLQSLFSAIPAEWYTRNNMDRYEGYYASVIYAFLASLGFDLRPEESTSHGRCDLVVDTGDIVYVMEFKVTELTGDGQKALAQIRERGYHHSYVQAGREVVLVGMDFSRKERNLTGFEYEPGNEISTSLP
ncbi:MAG TPA: AAA family ATPase, partial [Desulfomicrobiaceae bacterium]|nr:AAA family ATPase [Desulfomicrobiaceae bacterium]